MRIKITKKLCASITAIAIVIALTVGCVQNTEIVRAETIVNIVGESSNTDMNENTSSDDEETTGSKDNNENETDKNQNEDTDDKKDENPDETPVIDPDAYTLTAHRGYSGAAPANSMPAFEKAIAVGYDNIELDVRRCKPDQYGNAKWVISHDDSLKKTMGVNVNISDLTYSQLLNYSYTLGNRIEDYTNLKIVTYDQILQLIKNCKEIGKKIIWQIEIKSTDDDNYTQFFENELVKPIIDAEIQDCVMFSSFSATYLKKIKSIDSSLKTWYLSTILDESSIERAKKCGAEGISFKGSVNYTVKEDIDNALSEGLKLGVYTVNSPVIMGTFYQWGVRTFATDDITPMDVSKKILNGTYNVMAFSADLSQTTYTYDGKRKIPAVTVSYKGQELVEGLNYVLSYENNKNPGTATVYISGINNCEDEQKRTFKIQMPKATNVTVTASKTTYIKLAWTKNANVTGYIISKYNETTKKYEDIKTIKTPSTTTYKVSKLQGASKYKFRVRTYVTIDGKTYKSEASATQTAYTRPAKASIKKLKRYSGSKRLKVTWNKVPRCTGYEIKIATDKNMKKVVGTYKVKGSKNTSLKIKKLSKKKKYYVKVRAYLKVGSKTYNGVYSNVMKSKPTK